MTTGRPWGLVVLGLGLILIAAIWFTSRGEVHCVHGDGANAAQPCPDLSDRDGTELSAEGEAKVAADRRWKTIFAPIVFLIGLAATGLGLRMASEQGVLTPSQARRTRARILDERDAIGHSAYATEIAEATQPKPKPPTDAGRTEPR